MGQLKLDKKDVDIFLNEKISSPVKILKEWKDDGRYCFTIRIDFAGRIINSDFMWVSDDLKDLQLMLCAPKSVQSTEALLRRLRSGELDEEGKNTYVLIEANKETSTESLNSVF